LIRPVCEKRPTISSKIPESTASYPVVRNYPVKIYFSKPIDPSSFAFSGAGVDSAVYRENELFKNVTIQGSSSALESEDDPVAFEQYFEDPTLSASGKILTFRVKPDNVIPSRKKVTITISKNIVDMSSLNMAKDYDWTYYVSADVDTAPPYFSPDAPFNGTVIASVNSGISVKDSTTYFDISDASKHRLSGATLYMSLLALDDIASVDRVYVTETHPYAASAPPRGYAVERDVLRIRRRSDGLSRFAPDFDRWRHRSHRPAYRFQRQQDLERGRGSLLRRSRYDAAFIG
jgi:hypothetical protein